MMKVWAWEGAGHGGNDQDREERGSWRRDLRVKRDDQGGVLPALCCSLSMSCSAVPVSLSLTQLRASPEAPGPASLSPDLSHIVHYPLPSGSI